MDSGDANGNASNFSNAKSLESRIGIFLGHQGEKESKLHLPLRKEVLHWLFGLLHWLSGLLQWLLELLLGLFEFLLGLLEVLHWLFGSLHWLLEVLFWLLEELAGFPKERVLDMRGR